MHDVVMLVVVVVEPEEAVDILVDTEMVVGIMLLLHMDKRDMAYEPWEPDIAEHWKSFMF